MKSIFLLAALLLAPLGQLSAAEPKPIPGNPNPERDVELSETLQLPECHSIGWVRANTQVKEQKGWDGKLDEATWGTPSAAQVVERNWDWKLDDSQWRQAVAEKGEGKKEDATFELWMPGDIGYAKGIVVISKHGAGRNLFVHPELRKLARELHLALFTFEGNAVQRGFWPRSLLYERLANFARKSGHPELANAPLFLFGHSNGTGFSAIFAATESKRVWAWVSMRPGTVFQVYQPGAAQIPGLVIFGEDDQFFARPSKAESLAVVQAMRRNCRALWNCVVEPKTGHSPGEATWPIVFSFLRKTFAARVPADADPRQGPVTLLALQQENGWLGQNWNPETGGYQTLPIAPFSRFTEDKSAASWLLDAAYAEEWQKFQGLPAPTLDSSQRQAAAPTAAKAAETVADNGKIMARVDRDDAIYRVGEKAVFTVSLAKGASLPVERVPWRLTNDGTNVIGTGVVSLASGSAQVEGTLDAPGVLRLTVGPVGNPGESGIGVAAAAFDPFKIETTARPPADFDAFWQSQKEQLAKIPFDVKIDKIDSGKPGVEAFDVSLSVAANRRVHGYLALPSNGTNLPAVISLPGAGVRSAYLSKATAWAARGFLAMDVSVNDLPNGQSDEFYIKARNSPWNNTSFVLNNYPFIGLESRESYYFREVILGVLRAIDFLTARSEWNRKTLIVTGASQGGGLSLIAASLDSRVTAVAANVPALCDHSGITSGRPSGWPGLVRTKPDGTPEADAPAILTTAAYYDACNFARWIKVPAVVSVGLIDALPPTTGLAAYNLLAGPKKIHLAPLSGHSGSPQFPRMVDQLVEEQMALVGQPGHP